MRTSDRWQRFWRRRHYIVLPGLQRRFVASTLLSVMLCWLTVGLALFVPLADQIQNPANAQEVRRAAAVLLYLHDRLAFVGVLLFALVLLLATRASHRVAGPLWRIRRYLEDCAGGAVPDRVRFRRGDWLDEIVPSLERLFTVLRGGQAAATPDAASTPRTEGQLGQERPRREKARHGFTLIEIMIVCLVMSVLASIALPRYLDVVSKAKDEIVIAELKELADDVEAYWRVHGEYPAELVPKRLDPWGNAYVYLRIQEPRAGMTEIEYQKKMALKAKFSSQVRKDKNLHPLNTDFDLYSMGPDGKSQVPLTAQASRDDYIRANNGRFYGIAEDY